MAGQKAVFYKELKKIIVSENDNMNFRAWQTGNMEFNGTSIPVVLDVLSSVYHKTFIVKSEKIRNCRVNVSFENQELEAVLKVLEATLEIQFTIDGDVIELSGEGC